MFFLPAAAAAQSPLESPFGNLPTATKREAAALREAFADGADAAKILKEAVADGRDGAAVTFNLGNALFRNGDYAGAAKAYSAALSKIPNFFAARKNLAYSLDRLGDGERARENFAKALALSGGSDADILLWLASHYSGKSDWSSALSCVDAALVHAPERAGAEYAKAFYLFNLGRHAEAAKTCERILAKNFPDAAALKLLGKCRAKSGDLPGAIAALSMVPQDDPDFRSAEILRADIFFSARAYAEAAKIYESLGEDGRLGAAAEALARAGEFEKALEVLAKLPDSAGKFRSQARAHIGLGDAEGAKKSLSACLAESAGSLRHQLHKRNRDHHAGRETQCRGKKSTGVLFLPVKKSDGSADCRGEAGKQSQSECSQKLRQGQCRHRRGFPLFFSVCGDGLLAGGWFADSLIRFCRSFSG